MNESLKRISVGVAAALGLAACASAPPPSAGPTEQQLSRLPGRFEVVGRGPVTKSHTADVWVFEGRDGRDYAYTTTWGACGGCFGDRMYAWDVTDPSKPVLTDSVMVDARVVNDVMVNAERTIAVITREEASSRKNGIILLDLTEPAHPKPLSDYWETLTGGVHTSFIDGHYVYAVNDGTSDLHIIDISDPKHPHEVGRWGVPSAENKYLHDVWVKDGLAYLSYWDDGLVILDVGDGRKKGTPTKPQLVSQMRYRTEWKKRSYGNTHMAVPYTNKAGRSYVFVGDEIFPDNFDANRETIPGGYMHVFDVTNLEKPVEVAWYEIPEAGAHNIWVHDDTLYIAYYNAGLRAIDVSGDLRGPLRPSREIAVLRTSDEHAMFPNRPFAMTPMYHKGHVYAADFNSGLWIARVVPAPGAAASADATPSAGTQ